jgi:CRP/FNR family cyclic AMP-dependent transcriptional regulator
MNAPSVWHLTKLDLLAGAGEEELCNALGYDTIIKKLTRRRSFPIEEGTGLVYGLSEGLAKIVRYSDRSPGGLGEGRRVVDSLMRPGSIFGRLGDDGPKGRGYVSLESISPCTLIIVKAERLRSYLSMHPDTLLTVVQLLEDQTRKLSRRVESLVFKDVFTRVVETLLQLTADIPQTCPFGMAVDVRVTQSDIADLVGASRQAVNRCLRQLESRDILHRHDGVYCIPDLQKLHRLTTGQEE